jgi:hypothetical protein
MKIRHTVVFTFYEDTTRDQIDDVIKRLNDMGKWLIENVKVTDWTVAEHIPETKKPGRASLLQDCIFPNVESLQVHASSEAHKHVVKLTPKVCDWMAIDTVVE